MKKTSKQKSKKKSATKAAATAAKKPAVKTAGKITKAKTDKPKLINFKVSEKDHQTIQAKANRFADGNVSLWLRAAATHFTPHHGIAV